MMKPSKYPSDVEGVGIRGKDNTWMEIVVPCQLRIFKCIYEQEPATSSHSAKVKELRAITNKTSCKRRKPTPRKRPEKWAPFTSNAVDTGAHAW